MVTDNLKGETKNQKDQGEPRHELIPVPLLLPLLHAVWIPAKREGVCGWPVADKATRQPEDKQQDDTDDVKRQTYGIDARSRHALLLCRRDRFPLPAQNLNASACAHSIHPLLADLGGEDRADPVPPEPDRLVAHLDPTLVKKVLDIA